MNLAREIEKAEALIAALLKKARREAANAKLRKACSKCRAAKSILEFYSGDDSWCKECCRAKSRIVQARRYATMRANGGEWSKYKKYQRDYRAYRKRNGFPKSAPAELRGIYRKLKTLKGLVRDA